jgi:hypothetical protein
MVAIGVDTGVDQALIIRIGSAQPGGSELLEYAAIG